MDSCDIIKLESCSRNEIMKQREIRDSFDNIKEESNPRKEILKQFRRNLSDILTPDVTDKVLLKWLRAKNYNLRKSEELFRADYRIRAVFEIDQLIDTWDAPEVIQKYEFANVIVAAKDGTPIRYMAFGRGDFRGYVMSLDVYDIGRYCTKEIEKDLRKCKEQSIKLGKEINEVTYVVDMDNFAIGQAIFSGVSELGIDLFRLLQDHYPEIWKHFLIVNAPFYFHTIFNLFRPIFRRTALQKVHVASREHTQTLLLKYIDADVLPAFLGGKRVDSNGDPMCSEFMKFGGIIPEKYYLRNRELLNPTDTGVEDVWVPARGCHNVIVVVREANSIKRIELRTEGGSIGAVLLYREFGPDPENLDFPGEDEYLDPSDEKYNVKQCGPYVHLQTHFAPIDSYSLCPWPGIYIYRLDNSYNWLTQRRCIYRFRVLPPDAKPM